MRGDAMRELVELLKIVALAVATAVAYGIIHDQFTARICVEYFTVGHPPVFNTTSPTLLALGWGVIATWWVGVLLGVPAACLARFGGWPKLAARDLVRPLVVLLGVMAVTAVAAGFVGYELAGSGLIALRSPLADAVPQPRHAGFIADAAAHLASYGTGFAGGVVLWIWILVRRRRIATASFSAVQ